MEKQAGKLICIETNRDTQLIDSLEILYCYISGKNTVIVLNSGEELVTRYSLKFLEEVMLRDIKTLRCHSKNLVSLEHRIIYNPGFRKIILYNGKELIVAKDRKKMIKKILNDLHYT